MSVTDLAPYEAPEGGALARPEPDYNAGIMSLARLPQEEFETRLQQLQTGQERLAIIHRTLMVPGIDYGVIPGVKGKTLFKPGAEKLCAVYGLREEFQPDVTFGDGVTAPPISIVSTCRLHLGTLKGPVINTGHGAANSWEMKYRYRRGERACPSCGVVGSVIRGRQEFGGGWICFARKGGCGTKFAADDTAITGQVVGDVENPDPYELLNTLLKMSNKRAYVDATLRATATSGLYGSEDQDAAPAEATPGASERAQRRNQRDSAGDLKAAIQQTAGELNSVWDRQEMGARAGVRTYSAVVLGRNPAQQAQAELHLADLRTVLEDLKDRPDALKGAMAAYSHADGDPDDGDAMRAYMAQILGREVTSRKQYTAAELREFARQCNGPAADDPFIGE